MANKKICLGILALVLVSGILCTGCEINIGDFEDELILDSGYAWVTDDYYIDFNIFDLEITIDVDSYGLQFTENGTMYFIEKDHGNWKRVGSVRYSVRHGELSIHGEDFDYHVDDDNLWIDDMGYFEKKRVGRL